MTSLVRIDYGPMMQEGRYDVDSKFSHVAARMLSAG